MSEILDSAGSPVTVGSFLVAWTDLRPSLFDGKPVKVVRITGPWMFVLHQKEETILDGRTRWFKKVTPTKPRGTITTSLNLLRQKYNKRNKGKP